MATILSLSACGTPLYTMSEDEYELVVAYAAESVAKFNIYQNDGVISLSKKELESYLEEQKPEPETETQDTQDDKNTTIRPGEGGENQDPSVTQQDVTVQEALGLPDTISYTYRGMKVDDHYSETAGALTANEGNTFVILSFELKATADTEIDLFTMAPKFKLSANGKEVQQKSSLLTSDLATYIGAVEAKKPKTVVLLFEMSKEDAAAVKDFSLQVTANDKTSSIKLQ